MYFKNVTDMLQYICLNFSKQDIIEKSVEHSYPVLKVVRSVLVDLLIFLKEDTELQFNIFVDLTAVHYPDRTDKFQLIYQVYSLSSKCRLFILVDTSDDLPIQSVSGVYQNAGWFEREVYEMFGISFDYHDDLRRLFLSECEKNPLRKTKYA